MMKSLNLPASADDLTLSLLVSVPEGTPRGVFQLVHGMCEHKERYIPFMEFLTAHGYVCVIHDQRGHGASVKSVQDLGYLYEGGWRAMVEDVRVVCDWAQQEYPGLDYTLFGHSMGSMTVRSFAKRYDNDVTVPELGKGGAVADDGPAHKFVNGLQARFFLHCILRSGGQTIR